MREGTGIGRGERGGERNKERRREGRWGGEGWRDSYVIPLLSHLW